MPRYYVTITEVITNWKRVEMEADGPEQLVRRIVEEGDYDPESLEPQTIEVLATDVVAAPAVGSRTGRTANRRN